MTVFPKDVIDRWRKLEPGPKLAGSQTAQDACNAETLLLRIHLGLNPIHSLVEAVRVLHDEGREAFEKLRGPRCEYAHQWKPDKS